MVQFVENQYEIIHDSKNGGYEIYKESVYDSEKGGRETAWQKWFEATMMEDDGEFWDEDEDIWD